MAVKTCIEILKHLETELKTITIANGYTFDIKAVDREYKERAPEEYPFLFINDIHDKYELRILKNLHRKVSLIQIVGYVYQNEYNVTEQLGELLQNLKDDTTKCLAADTYFNSTDCELQIIEVVTDDGYKDTMASFYCNLGVIHYDSR